MAGPSSIPGTQGVVNLGAQPGNPAQDLLQIISAVEQIKQSKQASAMAKVKDMLQLNREHGIPFPEQEFMKATKEAGIPINEVMHAVDPSTAGKVGKSLEGNGQGAQSAFQLPSNSAEQNPGGGVGPGTKPMVSDAKASGTGVKAGPESFITQLMQKGTQNWQTAQMNKEQADALAAHVLKLKDTILSKSERGESYGEELGAMAAVTGQPINLAQFNYADASPEDRKEMVAIARGQETQSAKIGRESTMAMDLFKSGRYASLEDATKAAKGEQVAVKPDLMRMVQETQLTNEMFALGLDATQAKQVGTLMANGASLADALPKDIVPMVMKQYDLQQRQVKAAEDSLKLQGRSLDEQVKQNKTSNQLALSGQKLQKYAIDMQAYGQSLELQTKAKELATKLQDKSDEEANARFSRMIDAERAGIELDPEMKNLMINDLATRSGMAVKDVSGVWDWLTGSHSYAFTADTSKDKGLLNSAIGSPQIPSKASQFSPVVSGSGKSSGAPLPELERADKPKKYKTSVEHLAESINSRLKR